MPDLEPATPSPTATPLVAPPGLPDRIRVMHDAAATIVINRDVDIDVEIERLRYMGQLEFILDIGPSADRAARVYLRFKLEACDEDGAPIEGVAIEDTHLYRVNWRWLRGLVYVDDDVFWMATFDDLDRSLLPYAAQRFVYALNGAFTRLGHAPPTRGRSDSVANDHAPASGDRTGATVRRPANPLGMQLDGATSTARPEELPAYSPPDMRLVPAPAIPAQLPIHPIWWFPIIFGVGIPAFRRFYLGGNGERVTVGADWLSTDRLTGNADRPGFSPRTPAWVHCSHWVVQDVVTCNAGNLCGIDYKVRLADDETAWIRDTCLDWITGAHAAVQRFWNDGHCLRSDVAEKLLHQRPIGYATPDWDAALLEWARRRINISHVYKVVDGNIIAVD